MLQPARHHRRGAGGEAITAVLQGRPRHEAINAPLKGVLACLTDRAGHTTEVGGDGLGQRDGALYPE